MNSSSTLIYILVFSILINNVVLSQFLGICPFLGVSNKVTTAAGMGGAVVFVITIASAVAAVIYQFVLLPFNLEYLNTIVFILVIAALVQLVEMFLKKSSPSLYKALGVYLPLITTNCAVLGVVLLNVQNGFNFIQSVVNGFATACGFALSLVIMAGLREKMEYNDVAKPVKGMPFTMFTASLMAIAFCGFAGLK
ncbi:electron transport complex protein RnfA [Lachnospiraceae bacterium C1.1]|nr:RnfABCDGE type electron transport complex subunit A [Lachnospiraceae bacterium C1.1]